MNALRARSLSVVLAALGVVVAAPAAAAGAATASAPSLRTLSVTASHTAAGLLSLPVAARVDTRDVEGAARHRFVAAAGHYGGLAIYSGQKLVWGAIVDDALPDVLPLGAPVATLKPGLYRVVAIGDRSVQVALPLRGSAYSYALRATSAASVARVSATGSSPAPAPSGHAAAPFRTVGHHRIALALAVHVAVGQAMHYELCLAASDQPCAVSGGSTSGTLATPGAADVSVMASTVLPDVAGGDHVAVADDVAVGAQDSMRLVAYVL